MKICHPFSAFSAFFEVGATPSSLFASPLARSLPGTLNKTCVVP